MLPAYHLASKIKKIVPAVIQIALNVVTANTRRMMLSLTGQVDWKISMIRHNIKNSKYNAKKTMRDGMIFDSQKEARYYDTLKLLQQSGDVVMFLRQPSFDLPGNVKYRADFQVFYHDGQIEFIDVKGVKTKDFIMKKKMVEDLYPIEIKVV